MARIVGMMADIARHCKGDRAFLEGMIKRIAGYGFNMLVLNLEYRFSYPGYPCVGMPHSMTAQDARAISRLGKSLGVEVVPFLNCAGHCEGICMADAHRGLSAPGDFPTKDIEQLDITNPSARAFMRALTDTLAECFDSRFFHIGGDEVRGLAQLYPDLEEEERWGLGLEYILDMAEYVRAKGKTPMIWGDMLIRHPHSVKRIPKDVIITDWHYFTSPHIAPISNEKSLTLFGDAGLPVMLSNGVTAWMGTPVISVNSTMSSVAATQEYDRLLGEKALGTLSCVWETWYGAFFSCVWPWLYLIGREGAKDACERAKTDARDMSFLREYTALEWGLDDSSLMNWYDITDVQLQKEALFESFLDEKLRAVLRDQQGDRIYKLLHLFMKDLHSYQNPLPVLNIARRQWLFPRLRGIFTQLFEKALPIARHMEQNARRRREEAARLRQYNETMLAVFELARLEELLEDAYHAAAFDQFTNPRSFARACESVKVLYGRMTEQMDALINWQAVLIEHEDQTGESHWMLNAARNNLKARNENIDSLRDGRAALVDYQRYIRRPADMPAFRVIGPDKSH